MGNVLCFAAVQDGKVKRASLEVLSRFREIADSTRAGVDAVIAHPDPAQFVPVLGRFGASRVYLAKSDVFEYHLNEPLIRLLEDVYRRSEAAVLAFASTEGAKDVLGALAVRLGAAVLPDAASVELDGGQWVATRPVMAAKRLARTKASTTPVIISVRAGSYAAVENPVEPEVVEVPFDATGGTRRPELREVVGAGGDAVDLSEASVVVAAGRGVKDDVGKRLVEELAGLFGAAIGATRAVVESGLYPATAQIGQTGKVVSPDLYFALGISGAIQHVAGMVNSRVIVAINRDPDAPIFNYCTYGLVGDLYRIVPALTDALRKAGLG